MMCTHLYATHNWEKARNWEKANNWEKVTKVAKHHDLKVNNRFSMKKSLIVKYWRWGCYQKKIPLKNYQLCDNNNNALLSLKINWEIFITLKRMHSGLLRLELVFYQLSLRFGHNPISTRVCSITQIKSINSYDVTRNALRVFFPQFIWASIISITRKTHTHTYSDIL